MACPEEFVPVTCQVIVDHPQGHHVSRAIRSSKMKVGSRGCCELRDAHGLLDYGYRRHPHAVSLQQGTLPNPIDAHNDNVAARSLQGHTGTIVECSVCHAQGTLPLSLDGPHGMHPVGDSRWAQGSHGDLADNKLSACKACHGPNFRGTVLSTTATLRAWGPLGSHDGPGGG